MQQGRAGCEPALTTGVAVEGILEVEDARNKGAFQSLRIQIWLCETR